MLPKGTIIDIIFPSENYKALPSNPKCNITRGIKYFTSCILTGTTIRMVTAEKQTSRFIRIQFDQLVNPDKGVTYPFEIETSYDGMTLDVTDTNTTVGRTLTITTKPQSVDEITLNYDP